VHSIQNHKLQALVPTLSGARVSAYISMGPERVQRGNCGDFREIGEVARALGVTLGRASGPRREGCAAALEAPV
jgi:hypothetical protein